MVPHNPESSCNEKFRGSILQALDGWIDGEVSWHHEQTDAFRGALSSEVVLDVLANETGYIPRATGIWFTQELREGQRGVTGVSISYSNDAEGPFEGPMLFFTCNGEAEEVCGGGRVDLSFGGGFQYQFWKIVFLTSDTESLRVQEIQLDATCPVQIEVRATINRACDVLRVLVSFCACCFCGVWN